MTSPIINVMQTIRFEEEEGEIELLQGSDEIELMPSSLSIPIQHKCIIDDIELGITLCHHDIKLDIKSEEEKEEEEEMESIILKTDYLIFDDMCEDLLQLLNSKEEEDNFILNSQQKDELAVIKEYLEINDESSD